jgi:DNA-binding NarL/FixJ family response regulator
MIEVEPIRIFFVEDNDVIRFALKSLLKHVADFAVIGDASDGASAIEKLSAEPASVILIDIGLPDIDGIEVTKHVKTMLPGSRVLMLTASEDESDIFDALDAGADGYVLKSAYAKNLEAAIRSVRLGAVWLDPAIARLVLQAAQRPPSKRQLHKVEPIALSAEEKTLLDQVAHSDCQDGVCLVKPDFLQKLRRFSGKNGAANTVNESQMQSQA